MNNLRLTTKIKLAWLLALAFLTAVAITSEAQTCTPPLYQGNVNSCQGVSVRFLNRNAIPDIHHFTVRWLTDGVVRTLPGNAISDSRTDVGCNWASHVTITQFLNNGASCSTNSTGNAPHSYPCSLCPGGASAGVTIVSSANFRGNVTSGSLVSLFPDPGQTFTDRQEHAPGPTLPISLAGVSVEIGGTFAQLLDVSPGQINLLLPETLPDGPTEQPIIVNSTRGTTARYTGRVLLLPQSPGVFTSDATGQGVAAFVWLLVRGTSQAYYAPGMLPSVGGGDLVFALFYATGIKANNSTLFLGNGRSFASVFTGDSPGFSGLQQLVYRIPNADVWRSQMGAYIRVPVVGGSGSYDSNGFLVR